MATHEFDRGSIIIFTSIPFTVVFAVCSMVRGDDAHFPSMFDRLMYIVSISSDPFCDAFSFLDDLDVGEEDEEQITDFV